MPMDREAPAHLYRASLTRMPDVAHPDELYRAARAVVFGAAGFIGRWVARALCSRGAHLTLMTRNRSDADAVFARYGVHGDVVEFDLQQADLVEERLRQIRPSIVFNLAGYGVDPSEQDEHMAYRINADFVETLSRAVAATRDPTWKGLDIVHVGSALEYGPIGGNLSEDSAPRPATIYGRSKLAGTNLLSRFCKTEGIAGLTARLFTVYGPGEHPGRLLPSLLQIARTGGSLPLTAGAQTRDFTYVGDVADGLVRLGVAPARPGEILNLATGRLTSVREFAVTAAKILHIDESRLMFGSIPTRPAEMIHSDVTLARLRQLVDWLPPTGILAGIGQTWEFERTPHDPS